MHSSAMTRRRTSASEFMRPLGVDFDERGAHEPHE